MCGKRATYMQVSSGTRFCRGCFIQWIEAKVRRTIAKYGMLDPDDKIAIAISGGKDSLALSSILSRIEEGYPRSELVGITIDEGIGGYRVEAVEIASEFCRKIGIEFTTRSFKELYGYDLDEIVRAKGDELSPCSYCGVLRRKALNVLAREMGADKLATAHTLDDVVQTFLLNVVHGNVDRISRVSPTTTIDHPKFVRRIKPLFEMPERELSLYAHLKSIPFQSSVCPYATLSLRGDIRSLMNRLDTRHPGIKFNLFRSFLRIQEGLPRQTGIIGSCRLCGEPSTNELCNSCSLLSRK